MRLDLKAITGHISRRIPIRLSALIFLCFLVLLVFLISTFFFNNRQILDLENIRQLANRIYEKSDNFTDNQKTCILPNLDEWDPEIQNRMPFLDPIRKQCTPSITMMTSLENGVLKTQWNKGIFSWPPKCYYRCLRPVDDYNMLVDEFKIIDENGVKPECDNVEVECQKYFWFNYKFIHTQIVEKSKSSDSLAKNSDYKTPSLYWLILDSVSTSMFKRAMRRTRKVMVDKMQAVSFPYLNKVPLNSRPNAYAIFFGEQAYRLNSDPFGQKNITKQTGKHPDEICRGELDDLKFVGYDFKNAGYHTFMSEDWALGAINWPDCIGFKNPPADHFFRPFWLRLDGKKDIDRGTRSNMFEKSCLTYHNYVLNHILDFADSYKGKPKFALNWITSLTHDDNLELFHADYEFAEFFEQMEQKAKNSFIIFQSDHGIRTGPVRDLPIIGELEDNNPFFYLIIPEHLRKNPSLMQQLKENSRHLTAQFDVYASVVQIAKFGHEWNSETNFNQPPKPVEDRQFIGSSFFHPMNQPRTCDSLRVPFDFCICYQASVDLTDPKLARKVAQTIVDSINQQLKDAGLGGKCSEHIVSPKYPIRLEEFPKKNSKTRMLKAKFETMPGQALYQGFVKMDPSGSLSLLQTDFARLNMYVDQAYCIPESFFKNYCVCA